MHISAKDLYKELKAFGALPKTFTLKYIIIQTDTLTGKTREKPDGINKYALVTLKADGNDITVDFDMLRDFVKKMGKEIIEIEIRDRSTLKVHYATGDFVLFHISGTPGATVDLNIMAEREPDAKV